MAIQSLTDTQNIYIDWIIEQSFENVKREILDFGKTTCIWKDVKIPEGEKEKKEKEKKRKYQRK